MKKYLIAFLASLSCICALAAVGCTDQNGPGSTGDGSSSDGPQYTGTRTVNFESGEGYTFLSQTESGSQVNAGEYVNFELDLGGFYQDSKNTAVVYVNDTPVAHNGDGVYSIQITEDVTVRAENIKKDVSRMDGSGTQTSPFVVTKPIDLIYIAEQVNKGTEATRAYRQGWYIIANPIDCKGEELKVIGDLSTENSFFSGNIASNYDADTGEVFDCTISNFTINSQNANYVGLFGTVYADLSVPGSGQFYGIQLDNYTITAGLTNHAGESKSIAVGSLVGYGVGANMILCEATNGQIFVEGDESYYSYAGGLIGFQQAFYMEDYDQYFASEITYSHADVDIATLSGMVLYAGGISGFMTTNYPLVATSAIHNSYATGDVSGAIRAGGLAGGLGQYSVISNCYATGSVFASSPYSPYDDLGADKEYYGAYAGGLAGYAENDTIAHDSFFNGTTTAVATAGSEYSFTNAAIAGGPVAGTNAVTSREYLAINCLENIDLDTENYITQALGWGNYNWIFTKGELPVINKESSTAAIILEMEFFYVAKDGTEVKLSGKTSRKETYFNNNSESNSSYNTFGGFLAGGGLEYYYKADNGYISYGYFFDEACTQKVPNGYLPMKDITLYIGFENVSSLLGTYYYTTDSGKTVEIEFQADGTARYTDGASEQEAYYTFDGKNVVIESARLARYYDGEIIVDETTMGALNDPNFDLNRYAYYNFIGEVKDGTLTLYDGIYFTEEAPLTASTSVTATQYDAYKGAWTQSANVHKTYTFDGLGNWTYKYVIYTRSGYDLTTTVVEEQSGTYTIDETDGHISFNHSPYMVTGKFNADGSLELNNGYSTQILCREESYLGDWFADGISLTLNGIGENGMGTALLSYDDGTELELVYEASETDGYVALYYPHNVYVKDALFGYFTYNVRTHTLAATLFDANNMETGYTQYSLRVKDDHAGDWLANFENDAILTFNGLSLYSQGMLTVTEGDVVTEVEYTFNGEEGSFVYNGVTYTFRYTDEPRKMDFRWQEGEDTYAVSIHRPDVLANKVFVDANGNEYVFNGRGSAFQGSFTINGQGLYHYTPVDDNFDEEWTIDWAGGYMRRTANNTYELALSSTDTVRYLALKHEFMGDWAINSEFSLLKIGAMDLNGNISANFRGYNVTMTKYDSNMLTFNFVDRDYANMHRVYYVYIIEDSIINDKVLVLSEYDNLYAGEYVICSKVNALYGSWAYNKINGMTMSFDGVTSSYTNGTAKISWNGSDTMYYYSVKDNGVLMWSQEALAGEIAYYGITIIHAGEEGYAEALANKNNWVRADGAVLVRTEVDSLYLTEATDEDGNEYLFNGVGGILVNGELKYSYKYRNVTYHGNNTATIIVKDEESGKFYSLFLDYTNNTNTTITIGEEVADPDAENA